MEPIRLGTVGSGMIVRAILDNVKKFPEFRLTAVYSRSPAKAKAMADSYGAEGFWTDLEAFFREAPIDYVYIASPNSLHYFQAKQALLAGKNVLLEKPFCTCAAHARELFDIAESRGLVLLEAVPTAFLPNLPLLRSQLPKVGPIRLVQGNYSQYSSRYDLLLAGQTPNVFNPAFGGGCLMDINFYNVWLNAALFGLPRDVRYYPNRHPNGIDTSGILILDYGSFVSTASGAKDTWGENYFLIEGEKGYIHVEKGPNGLKQIRTVTRDSDETQTLQPDPDHWFYEVESLSRLLQDPDPAVLTAHKKTTLDTMEILENARRSCGLRFPWEL